MKYKLVTNNDGGAVSRKLIKACALNEGWSTTTFTSKASLMLNKNLKQFLPFLL